MGKQTGGDGTVAKALEILDSVALFEKPVRFSELLNASAFPKATLYRFLQTLTNQNMLAYDRDTGTYCLGARLVGLAHTAWKNASLAPIARKFIKDLAVETGETTHLAQIDNGQVLFVDKFTATNRFETLAQVGMVAPAYCTGVGKVMMAFMAPERLELVLLQQAFFAYTPHTHLSSKSLTRELDQIRKNGVAYDREEHEVGIISIAAPVLTGNGRMIGALSIATSTSRTSLSDLSRFSSMLVSTTEKIGTEATSWQFPS